MQWRYALDMSRRFLKIIRYLIKFGFYAYTGETYAYTGDIHFENALSNTVLGKLKSVNLVAL